MAFIVADRVREVSASIGTGVFNLSGSPIGYQTFSASVGNGNTTYYVISNPGVNEWEVGIGTVGAGTLTRTTILASSNGGTAVNFTAGSKDVFVTYPAEAAVFADNTVTLTNKTLSVDNNTVAGVAASSFVLSNASGNIDGAAAQKTIPSGVVVGTSDTQTLTNKTFGDNPVFSAGTANGVAYLNGSKVLITGSALTFDGTTLNFGGTAQRITGDFSNATTSNRVLFQTSTTNSYTSVGAVPNGTNTVSSFQLFSKSDTENCARGDIAIVDGAYFRIYTDKVGTGTALPMVFAVDAVEKMRLTSTGLGIGTSSPSHRLDVNGLGRMRFSSGTGAGHWLDTVGNASRFFVGTDAVTEAWRIYDSVAAAQRMTLDSFGNLGLGVPPSAWVSGYKALEIGALGSSIAVNTANGNTLYAANSYVGASGSYYGISGYASRYIQRATNGQHEWYTAPSGTAGNAISFTQAMTLDASGNLLVGTTSTNPLADRVNGYAFAPSGISGWRTGINGINFGVNTTAGKHFQFYSDNGSTFVSAGSITTSGSATAFNTLSDYRLKENIQPMQGALDVVAQLNPVTYTWKADGSDGQGFIAHELQAVVPDCVTGEKDAVDEEGKPVYQGIDTSFLAATTIKAIQELVAEVNQLKAEVAALKQGN